MQGLYSYILGNAIMQQFIAGIGGCTYEIYTT